MHILVIIAALAGQAEFQPRVRDPWRAMEMETAADRAEQGYEFVGTARLRELEEIERRWNAAFARYGGRWASDPAQAAIDGDPLYAPGCEGLRQFQERVPAILEATADSLKSARRISEALSTLDHDEGAKTIAKELADLLLQERERSHQNAVYASTTLAQAVEGVCGPSLP